MKNKSVVLGQRNWTGVMGGVIYADNIVKSRGDALFPILWRGRTWAVTRAGIEKRDGGYFIAANRLRENFHTPYHTWVGHIGKTKREDFDLIDFTTAYFVACAMHSVRLSPDEVDTVFSDFDDSLALQRRSRAEAE